MSLKRFASIALATASLRAQPAPPPNPIADGGNSDGFDMAPETRLEVVEAANAKIKTPLPPGPFAPTWESLKKHYRVPAWLDEAKFGLSIHWGLYAVPAYHNEWYEKHMYAQFRAWHAEHFGPPDKFGYKDFISLFRAEKFDPEAWAELFKKSGARFVAPTVQHHDNFALWDSKVTPFNSMAMGPHRDLMGELAKAIRARGLKFGISNHGIENFQFINPPKDLADDLRAKHADLFDPQWADFYNYADRSDAACEKFLINWWDRNIELIENFQPDLLWFDNGIDQRYLDPLKLRIAAYYYNRAIAWGRDVSITTKKAAYSPTNKNSQTIASIIDFEKIGSRSPSGIRTGNWQVHETIGSPAWGYTNDLKAFPPGVIIARLADTVAKNGCFFLNLSPKADGTIPQDQQDTLLAVGRWLDVNGEAIYGTHNWATFGVGGGRGEKGLHVRFTVKGDALYAIVIGMWPAGEVNLTPIAAPLSLEGKITRVTMLGAPDKLGFEQRADGLHIKLPAAAPCEDAFVFKINGLKMNPPTATPDGNPL